MELEYSPRTLDSASMSTMNPICLRSTILGISAWMPLHFTVEPGSGFNKSCGVDGAYCMEERALSIRSHHSSKEARQRQRDPLFGKLHWSSLLGQSGIALALRYKGSSLLGFSIKWRR